MLVPTLGVALNLSLEISNRSKRAATNRFTGNLTEPDLDLIEPRSVGGRVVKVKANPSRKPSFDSWMLMRAVVVHDQMHIELFGHASLNVAQEGQELLMAMARLTLSQYLSIGYVQSSKQGDGAVTFVVMSNAFDIAQPQRQHRLSALQRLDLRLFVYAQHQRVIGWIQIQPHDVTHLLNEERIVGQLERAGARRLHAKH